MPAGVTTKKPLDLDAIEARASAATAGPFKIEIGCCNEEGELDVVVRRVVPPKGGFLATFGTTGIESVSDDYPETDETAIAKVKETQEHRDAEFLCAARGDVLELADQVKRWRQLYGDVTRILAAVADQLGLDPVALAEDPSVVLLDRIAARELFDALRQLTDDVDPDKNPPGKTFRRMAAEGNAALSKHAKRVARG